MHAEINEEVGEQSCFLFNDDKFYLDELYGLNFSGQIGVLCACNTGRSFKDVRNGNASLQRAFMYAGIPSTLSSLWGIPDRSTQEIMESFYQSLKEGRTNGEAIREAKIEFLKTADDPHLRSPYFWAGFVLSGQDQVISLEPIPNEFSYWYWIFGSIGIALIIVSLWYRFRRGEKHQLH
jgi:CHAT domain-containing protein